jgi:hypothetical protein
VLNRPPLFFFLICVLSYQLWQNLMAQAEEGRAFLVAIASPQSSASSENLKKN